MTGRRSVRRTAWAWLLCLASVGAAAADAVPVDWSFEVLEVSVEPGGHVVRLKPMPPGRKFPRSCETFVVHASYTEAGASAPGDWTIPRQLHDEALKYLRRAEASREIVRFGSIGRGFAAIADSPRCEVASEALVYIAKPDGRTAVFSAVGAR